MYHLNLTINGEQISDTDTRKSAIIDTIARETGLTKRELAQEIEARTDSTIHRDQKGVRIWVTYEAA